MKMSSNTPSGFTLDLSASSNIIGVGNKSKDHIWDKVSTVVTLMAAPKSIKVIFMGFPLTKVVTTRTQGFAYFSVTNPVDIKLATFHLLEFYQVLSFVFLVSWNIAPSLFWNKFVNP